MGKPTIVSWIGPDGEREGGRLVALHPASCEHVKPAQLSQREALPLILVGHLSELERIVTEQFDVLKRVTSWLVLANCSSGMDRYSGPLAEGNRLSPAQAIANRLDMKVTATTRPLTFDEVGMGQAFARSMFGFVIPSQPAGGAPLWQEFGRQDTMDELAARFRLM